MLENAESFDFFSLQNHHFSILPLGIYMFKVNNRNTRTRCEICSKLTKIIVNFEHFTLRSSVFINFEQVNVDWVAKLWASMSKSKSKYVVFCSPFFYIRGEYGNFRSIGGLFRNLKIA